MTQTLRDGTVVGDSTIGQYDSRGRVASIHRAAESVNSRKLTLRIVQPYALEPELWTVLPRSNTPGAGTLIHPRIKIRSRSMPGRLSAEFPRSDHGPCRATPKL